MNRLYGSEQILCSNQTDLLALSPVNVQTCTPLMRKCYYCIEYAVFVFASVSASSQPTKVPNSMSCFMSKRSSLSVSVDKTVLNCDLSKFHYFFLCAGGNLRLDSSILPSQQGKHALTLSPTGQW